MNNFTNKSNIDINDNNTFTCLVSTDTI